MRLLILSDLHLELWREHAPRIDPLTSRPDAVVLAGDIHAGAKGIGWAAETFAGLPVVYVPGNHEYYGSTLEDVEAELIEASMQYPSVHYLNPGEVVIGGVRFIGCCLWTDYFLFGAGPRWSAMIESANVLSDYHRIRVKKLKYKKLHPSDVVRIHAEQKSWLKKKLAEPFDGKTVVVTHMAPSMKSVVPKYAEDLTSAGYASRLDDLVAQADLYVHGHMHDSVDYCIEKCRVVCNPRGYRTSRGEIENGQFDSNFAVEL